MNNIDAGDCVLVQGPSGGKFWAEVSEDGKEAHIIVDENFCRKDEYSNPISIEFILNDCYVERKCSKEDLKGEWFVAAI